MTERHSWVNLENHACPGARAHVADSSPRTPWPRRSLFWEFHRWARTKFRPPTRAKKKQHSTAEQLVMQLLKEDIRPSQIITRESLLNAIASVAASRRFDQRRFAPAGDCQRRRRAARLEGLSTKYPRRHRFSRTSSLAAVLHAPDMFKRGRDARARSSALQRSRACWKDGITDIGTAVFFRK